ncbi:MAG: hypothetical protein IPL49_16800 [Saprospirales bacterium]|nr:hypothetical protein [Saprospirales bacterium]
MRRNSTIAGLFLVALVFLISSCFKDGLLNLTNGLAFNVNAKLLHSPISVSFINADPSVSNIPDNIFLDMYGANAEDLFTPTGGNNLVVIEGLVYIGIKDQIVPTASDPLKFGIRASAPGFYPANYFVSLYNRDIPQYVTVYLVEEGNNPNGVSDRKEYHQISSTGFTSGQNLETPLNNGKEERVKLHVDSGTQLLTETNALVTGNVQVNLVHYDNRSNISLRAISGITESIPATTLGGADLGTVTFYPAGLYSLSMTAGAVAADHFSKPLQVTMTLNPQTYNPETGQYIKQGDQVHVWRFDEGGSKWVEALQTPVVKVNEKLAVLFDQPRAGTWMVGQFADLCEVGATLTIQSNIPQGACDRNFYTTLVDINTGKPVSSKWSDNYLQMQDQTRITLTEIPKGVVAKLQVWEGVRGCEGQLLGESQPFNACNSNNFQLNFKELNTNGWLPVSLSFSGYCEVKGSNVILKPNNRLMYRPAGCGVYGLLGEFPEGEGCVATLKKGVTYDFKMLLGEEGFEFMHITMEDGVYNYPLPNGETVLITIETTAGIAKLNFEGLPLPGDICELIEE